MSALYVGAPDGERALGNGADDERAPRRRRRETPEV